MIGATMNWVDEVWEGLCVELIAAFPVGTVISLGAEDTRERWVRRDVHGEPRWVEASGVVTRSASHDELANGLFGAGLHSVELPDGHATQR